MWSKSLLLALQIASHLAYMVLLPLGMLGGAGILLDRQYESVPTFMLIGIGLAFVLTLYWIKVRLREIIEATMKKSDQ